MGRKLVSIAILVCLTALCACEGIDSSVFGQPSGAEPEFVFRYAENQAADYPTTLGAYRFAELVSERSSGRIEIVVYHNAQLGTETKVLEQLRFGGIDFARVSLSQLAEIAPEYNVLQLPYLYRDEAHMWSVLDGEIGEAYLQQAGQYDLVGLSWYDAGARSFYTRQPLRHPEDLRGLTIRVQESAMMADMISLLGGTPVQIAFGDVYSSLQTAKVDGAENNFPSYDSTSHYEVAPYFYQDEHNRIPEIQLMSRVSMNKLPEEDRQILAECARESALFERTEWTRRELRSEEFVRSRGVEVVVPSTQERQALQTLCMPLYEKYAADNMDVVSQIMDHQ